jgi:hypothetical protein
MRPATVGDPRRESSVHRVAKVSIERGYHDGWRNYREPQKHWFSA